MLTVNVIKLYRGSFCDIHTSLLRKVRRCSRDSSEFVTLVKHIGGGDVKVELDDNSGVGVVTLVNPEKKNAMSPRMMVKFGEIVDELSQWSHGKAVVLKGADGTFCSGGDLQAVMRDIGNPREGGLMCEYMQRSLQKFFNMPLITLAALEGKSVGGGAELATACDFRLMKEDAVLGFVHKRLAVSTGWGGGTRLVQLVGRKVALDILLSGKLLTMKDAMDLSLIDGKILDGVETTEFCKNWLTQRGYLDTEPLILQTLKTMVSNADNSSVEKSLESERDLFVKVWGGNLHKQALRRGIKHK